LAFPDLSLRAAHSRNTFGGTPHPRDEAGTIASHSGRLLISFVGVLTEVPMMCQEKMQIPQKSKIETRALSPPAQSGRGRWNALFL